MSHPDKYRPHLVLRQDKDDGTILLRSGYDMSPVADTSRDWLHRWAAERPETVFLAERSGEGWREMRYGETLEQVRALAAGLLARGLSRDTPILIISGNGVDHGLLTLAAHYVGIPTVPVAEQYSLIPGAQKQLTFILDLIDPKMVYAVDGERFGDALAMEQMVGRDIVVSRNPGQSMSTLDMLCSTDTAGVEAAAADVGPNAVVKILLTSGSTSHPKGVETTHRMMCSNQAMILDALPFLADRVPRIVDWLPWNHVFGGSHNFNMMLSNGGSLYVDDGKPAPPLIGKTIENNKLMSGTMAFNVPVGFALLRDAMREDAELRRAYFQDLDMLFYAGASLPRDVWEDLAEMAMDVRGDVPLMNSSWGLTETSPACMQQHEPTQLSGVVGVPMTGCTVKLVPEQEKRFEVRVAGPNIMKRYFKDVAKTDEAFDRDGFFRTGDAMSFVDPDDMSKGLQFDGRISEDFKLMTGNWVRATALRLEMLTALAPLAADAIVTGIGRAEVGLLIVPSQAVLQSSPDMQEDNGAIRSEALQEMLKQRLAEQAKHAAGSTNRVVRALIMAEAPSMAEGEITAKGNLNFAKIHDRRADLIERLYSDSDPAVVRI